MAHSFSSPEHLPHKREQGDLADPRGLPRQRNGTTPQMHGRYPDFDVMDDRDHWDPVTRDLLVARVEHVPDYRFFDARERRALAPFLDLVLAQDAEPRVPVLQLVDAKLYEGRLDGYRYDDMPSDDETWKRVAAHLEGFADAGVETQRETINKFSSGELDWEDLNVARAWSVVMRGALSEFYSHPWAFNEIGFRGPAYPRGYMRRNIGPTGVEPHEPQEAFGIDPVSDLEGRA